MVDKNELKRAVIAGASEALNYRERKPSASDEEILKHITKNAEKIEENID